MRIQIATLFTLDSAGRLVRVNDLTGHRAPRFFLGRTALGNEWRVRHDVPQDVVDALHALCATEPPGDEFLAPPYGAPRYEALLAREAPVQSVWTGPTYRFPERLPDVSGTVVITSANADLLEPYLSAWLEDVAAGAPLVAVVQGGRAVSICCSVRVTPVAHEAGVETHALFRGRGYAGLAIAEWAKAIRALGSIPLYSTSWQNTASQAVARKLGLVRFGTHLHVT
jgi:hypothetical protein